MSHSPDHNVNPVVYARNSVMETTKCKAVLGLVMVNRLLEHIAMSAFVLLDLTLFSK